MCSGVCEKKAGIKKKEKEEEEELCVRLGALNTDWTNRHASINTPETLAAHVRDTVVETLAMPDVVTLSELSSARTGSRILSLPEMTLYDGFPFKVDRDHVQTLFRTDRWQLVDEGHHTTFGSAAGRYFALLLEHVVSKKRLLHFSVHLPHKKGKQEGTCSHHFSL